MLESIDRSRSVGLRRALIGLAIPMASEAAATRLCRAGYATLEAVAEASEEELQQVDDIGPKVAASLWAHLNRDTTRAELERLRELGVDLDVRDEDLPPKVVAGAPLEGKTVVITGALADPRSGEKVPRPAFQRLCERAGATTASSVSGSTDMLICGADVGASKIAKAEKLEVEVVDQEVIWRLLIDAGVA
jgi:DNA ligase (NAD+)